MRRHYLTASLASFFLLAARAETLEGVLKRMDAAAAAFQGMTADLKSTEYAALLKDLTEESGKVSIVRLKRKDTRVLVEFNPPNERQVLFADHKLEIYYPKINTIQEYNLAKESSLIQQFLLLGFGASGSDLQANFDVIWKGADAVNGQKAYRLELTPKSEEARKHVKRVELWILDANVQPVQQRIWKSSKDYTMYTYSNMRVNPGIREGAVHLRTQPKPKRERPQK